MYKTIIVFVYILCYLGCYAERDNKTAYSYDNFQNHYLRAMSTTNMDVVIDEINYLDSIIKTEGNKHIKSIYYNKAQLYYRLKKYDDALEVLCRANDETYDVAKAALLILLGRAIEARKLLDKQIEKNKMILYKFSGNQEQKNNLILGIISMYTLSDIPVDSFLEGLIDNNIITQAYFDNVLMPQIVNKDILLNSMWPN
jgi:tetratricopeptide (TPR) repeat protein